MLVHYRLWPKVRLKISRLNYFSKHLILSNIYSFIASKYDLQNLQYLNLSGCVNMTSLGMNLFTEMSRVLDGENVYYCDNITDGPLNGTANGCANLESDNKFCCRSGQ